MVICLASQYFTRQNKLCMFAPVFQSIISNNTESKCYNNWATYIV